MLKTVPIQIALQGGGAKLVGLLAACQAIADLEETHQLRVTRLAATSAGSIAGALFAAEIDMAVVKTHLKAKAASFSHLYTLPTGWGRGWSLLRKQPFWDPALLKQTLLELFGKRKVLSDLKRPIRIVATDLKNLKKVVRAQPDDALVDSIMDSCAIPLFFRTAAQDGDETALVVDGGICANLPSEELLYNAEDGDVVGISFDTLLVPNNPTGVVALTQTLLTTAMEHAVLRAREQLGSRLLSLSTTVDTFDFKRAFTEGLDTEWDNCYNQTKVFFQEYVASVIARDEDQRAEEAKRAKEAADEAQRLARDAERQQQLIDSLRSIRKTANAVYSAQESKHLFQYERFSLAITAYSLLPGAHQPDTLVRRSIFKAANGPIYSHLSTSLTEISEQPVLDEYQMLDKDGNALVIDRIELEPEYIVLDELPSIRYKKIVFFHEPLKIDDSRAPFQLLTTEKFTGAVGRLGTSKVDWISVLVNRVSGKVPLVDVVVHLPKAYLGTRLVKGGLRDENGGWIDFHPGSEIPPRVMNVEYPAPLGFFSLGWRGIDVPGGTRFGCMINATKGAGQ